MKAIRIMRILTKLDKDNQDEIMDMLICNAIENGVDIDNIDNEIEEEEALCMYI